MPTELVSHYRILGPLGSGGMGIVYRAEDTTLHRTVALKFISEQATTDPKVYERLRREARTASALNHPNICTIYEVGEDAGEVFISMEYVEGRTLAELIEHGPLPIEAALRYGRQLSSALAHAHERGVLHGDLKTLNIVVTPSGDAKILDFGLARRTNPEFDQRTLETVTTDNRLGIGGTLPYMAPEQIEGHAATPRTDIWSFGVVLYEMVTGTRPFQGENHYQLCHSILHDSARPLPSQLPAGLTTVVSRCLEKEPERRYQRANEARAALETLSPGREQTGSEGAAPWHRWRALWGMVMLLFVVAAVVVVMSIRRARFGEGTPSGEVRSAVLLSVLPPTTVGDASQSAFEKGLADTLNSRLGELSVRHALAVIPMNATLDKRVTTVEGARQQFGANLVLVLNVQRAAEDVRVNYALVDAHSQRQVRSGTITSSVSDPFGLQDRVFESVAASLDLQLAPQEKKTVHGTREPAAYDFYVQGRGYLQDYVVPEKVESAITLFKRALETDPSYAAASAGLGDAYLRKYQLGHDTQWADAAVTACQKAVELGPQLAAAHTCLGRAFRGKGNYEEAAEQYRRALELEPASDEVYGGLANSYEQLGRVEEAEKLYKQAIAVRPGYWATYNWLGLFYMTHARYEEAASQFTQAVSLAPDCFTGYYNLGAVRILQGKYAEAIPILQQSLDIRETAEAFSNLGTAHFQMRQYAQSAADFEKASKLDEKSYAMWGNLGDAYYWTPGRRAEAFGAYGKAIALGEENLRLNPNDAQLLGYLAEYYAMRGEKKTALERLNASLRLQPKSPDLLLNAGIVYQQVGETKRAMEVLEKAVALGVSPEMLRDTPNFDALRDDPRFQVLIKSTPKK